MGEYHTIAVDGGAYDRYRFLDLYGTSAFTIVYGTASDETEIVIYGGLWICLLPGFSSLFLAHSDCLHLSPLVSLPHARAL